MALIQNQLVIAANTTTANVIAGTQHEFLPADSFLQVALVGSAVGLVADVFSGTDVLALNLGLSIANRVPIFPDDFILEDAALAGERLVIRCTNTTAGALTLFYAVKITEVAEEE